MLGIYRSDRGPVCLVQLGTLVYHVGASTDVLILFQVVLDSDDKLFGGFNRIDHTSEYFSTDGLYDNRPCSFSVYAPSRTAVVYALSED
ncbi:hypothetical protein BHE74_00015652 [Ensete ventricosum]|uniref:Uncharacterized protein n=1 Tax=Ensete ventricosum TaxID=4639 RepID=A0A426Z364_ENSVE|nr:hypothetical protein B296_00039593 [Ensete ventricosum]RWW21302.1 hypothetical protein GW17_00014548 [Ensete ventricosum]RWW76272.1 hypothetical protein BHE74_00015652 [Ensete ventricosum]RZR94897.1 hypothetical protein BHM03_00023672 [Ensete ventricosum]